MKLEKSQEAGERKPQTIVVTQAETIASSSTAARDARTPFDDLHGRIITRAYELYIQRGCREGCAEEDWLDAEQEIVSRDFPVSASTRSSAPL